MFKVTNERQVDTKSLQAAMKKMCDSESAVDVKTLFVPDHLLCLISGDLMKDPVTLESGCTFERASIEQYFKTQRETAKRALANADSEVEEERNMTEADFLRCPVTM